MILDFNNKHPKISTTSFIAPNATIIGNVEIKNNASIWFGALVRGDEEKIEIGENTNIQDGCILHTDKGFPLKIGNNVVVGHGAILHGCTIENDVLIGIGAIILNGAHIKKGSIIGAGALVPEGKDIDCESLAMGVPVKIIREVTDAEKKRTSDGVKNYVTLSKTYLEK